MTATFAERFAQDHVQVVAERDIAQGRADALARLVMAEFAEVDAGHCARVNYLDRAEAEAVCQAARALATDAGQEIDLFVLGPATNGQHELGITSDRAIELRNRKLRPLGLLIPPDVVDAAASSLANSFAEIDGRQLYRAALNHVISTLSATTRQTVRAIMKVLTGRAKASDRDLLDLALAARIRESDGTLHRLGLELWRVGLIADARPEFADQLSRNKAAVAHIARPIRPASSTRDRVAETKVTPDTARALERHFAGKSLNNVRSWSRDLIAAGLPFDTWTFPEWVETDLSGVTVAPFLDKDGAVEKTYRKTFYQEGQGTPLLFQAGKDALTVKWSSDPAKPVNVAGWRVTIIPATEADDLAVTDGQSTSNDDYGVELPSRDVKGTSRTVKIKLDLEPDEIPQGAVVVRVAAIDGTGAEITELDDKEIADTGDAFYIVADELDMPTGQGERRRTVPTLAFGRLQAAVDAKASVEQIELTQPNWDNGADITYFTASLDPKTRISVALSPLLLALERRTLESPVEGGRWSLRLDELRPATMADIAPHPVPVSESKPWVDFWRARAAFFERLRPRPKRGVDSGEPASARDVVEVAEWNPEQVNAAIRHAQAYRALLDALVVVGSSPEELHDALSIDTLSVTLDLDTPELAIVVLPTHPIRALWHATHAELFKVWEQQALNLSKPADRKRSLDLELAQDLRPVNMPAFACGVTDPTTAQVFFRNLGFSHGVALPAHVTDPLRRYLDIAQVLGFGAEPVEADDRSPDRLAGHLDRFADIHPYADPLQVALVNPDKGELLASALERSHLFKVAPPQVGASRTTSDDDERDLRPVPLLEVTAYTLEGAEAALTDLGRIRSRQGDQQTRHPIDHLHPRLTTAVRPLSSLLSDDQQDLAAAHVAILADLCRPRIRAVAEVPAQEAPRSVSLYGLISRIHGRFDGATDAAGQQHYRWDYRVAHPTVQGLEPHPAGPRFGNTLIEAQAAVLSATAKLLDPAARDAVEPALEVTLDPEHVRILEWFHDNTDWVVTVDRFFGIDYFDSPNDDRLKHLAEKHVIDYAPDFVDGLGHRMIVTTAWREEIESILRRAMDEIGIVPVDATVRELLSALKTVSGRLALQALSPEGGPSQAVGLALVISWLRTQGRLQRSILVPIDAHRELFLPPSAQKSATSQQRCDLLLIEFKRGVAQLRFIQVICRPGPLAGFDTLVEDMRSRLFSTRDDFVRRFFDNDRIDAPLQRARLGNILRFYAARAERYGLLSDVSARTFREYLTAYERTGTEPQDLAEGYVVCMDDPGREPHIEDDYRVTVLTSADLDGDGRRAKPVQRRIPEAASMSAADEPVPSRPLATTAKEDARDSVGFEPYERLAQTDKPDNIDPALTPKPQSETLPGIVDTEPDALQDVGDAASVGKTDSMAAAVTVADDLPAAMDETNAGIRVDNDNRQNEPIAIALGEGFGRTITWQPGIEGSPHLFITGIPGQGKSVTTRTLLRGLADHGVPSLVFDFHGEYAEDTQRWAPNAGPLNSPLIADAAEGLPFSPFEADLSGGTANWRSTAQAIAEIFGYVCGLGDIQQDALMLAIRGAYQHCGFEMEGESSETLTLPTLDDVRERIEAMEQAGRTRNVLARVRPLLELDVFRPPADGASDFASALRSGVVVRLDRLMSEVAQNAVGAFLIRKVYRDMFAWGLADRIRLAVVLDEAHRLSRDTTLPKILKEGRKYGVLVIAASQGLSDFHSDVIGNVGTKIAFRANNPESRKVAGFFSARDRKTLPAKLERLQVAEALVQTPEMPQAVTVRMHYSRTENE